MSNAKENDVSLSGAGEQRAVKSNYTRRNKKPKNDAATINAAIEQYTRECEDKACAPTFRSGDLDVVPFPDDAKLRDTFYVVQHLRNKLVEHLIDRCVRCWLLSKCCACYLMPGVIASAAEVDDTDTNTRGDGSADAFGSGVDENGGGDDGDGDGKGHDLTVDSVEWRLYVLIHPNEMFRPSNTGKLIARVLGASRCKMLVSGLPQHERRLDALLDEGSNGDDNDDRGSNGDVDNDGGGVRKQRTFLLYPTDDAISVADALRQTAALATSSLSSSTSALSSSPSPLSSSSSSSSSSSASSSSLPLSSSSSPSTRASRRPVLNLILLDATWSKASGMRRRRADLQSAPCVSVNMPKGVPSLFAPLRRQTR
jgi:hypothetical protein